MVKFECLLNNVLSYLTNRRCKTIHRVKSTLNQRKCHLQGQVFDTHTQTRSHIIILIRFGGAIQIVRDTFLAYLDPPMRHFVTPTRIPLPLSGVTF